MRYKGSPRRHFSIAAQKRFVRSPVKKKRRFKRHRSGFRVRQEIRREFYSDRFSIPKRAFARLCREILSNQHVIIDRIESSALEAATCCRVSLISLFRHTNESAAFETRDNSASGYAYCKAFDGASDADYTFKQSERFGSEGGSATWLM